MPTITDKIQKTLDQISVVQQQGQQLENEISQLQAQLNEKQQQHNALADQFRHLHTRLATLREIEEPETHDNHQIPRPQELAALKGSVPPEVFEQVKNVLAASPELVEEEKQPAPTHVHKGHRKNKHK